MKPQILPMNIKNMMVFMIWFVTNVKKKKEALYSKDTNKIIITRPLCLKVISINCKRTSFNEG